MAGSMKTDAEALDTDTMRLCPDCGAAWISRAPNSNFSCAGVCGCTQVHPSGWQSLVRCCTVVTRTGGPVVK